jgi:hypothetical protein
VACRRIFLFSRSSSFRLAGVAHCIDCSRRPNRLGGSAHRRRRWCAVGQIAVICCSYMNLACCAAGIGLDTGSPVRAVATAFRWLCSFVLYLRIGRVRLSAATATHPLCLGLAALGRQV